MFEVKKLLIKDNLQNIIVDISFKFQNSMAIVGQSGSGKSLTLKAIMNLLPKTLDFVYESNIDYKLGETLSFVPQNPFTSLSQMSKINRQFFNDDVIKFFDAVKLDRKLANRYPMELSGGELQRVLIAIALSIKPKLILLDEPTTALDTISKNSVIELIKNLKDEFVFSTISVSHDIDSISKISDDILIMNSGRVVEFGKIDDVLTNPKDSYTVELINSSFKNREFRK
jgi:peptide/nickel transport system ATP-binding protein